MLNLRVFFGDGLPEKKLQLVDMSILLILLSPGPGCYILTPLRDQHPRRSIPSQESPLLATSVCPVPAHVPYCVTTLGPLQPCATATHAPMKPRESTLMPFCNVPPLRGRAHSDPHKSFLRTLSSLVRSLEMSFHKRSCNLLV
jgi:hypothetical protein